jgi:hypothetical protein
MSAYKFYILDFDGRSRTPAHVLECDDDSEAIRQARRHVDRTPVEVWRDITRVARLEPDFKLTHYLLSSADRYRSRP